SAYVTLLRAGRVGVIPAGATQVAARVPVGNEPFGLALHPDGQTLFVSSSGSAEIVALELPTLQERFRVRVDADPRGLAISPDGEKLFVAHLTGRAISVIDLAHGQSVRRVPLPGGHADGEENRRPNLTYAIAISPGGRRIYAPHLLEDNGA